LAAILTVYPDKDAGGPQDGLAFDKGLNHSIKEALYLFMIING